MKLPLALFFLFVLCAPAQAGEAELLGTSKDWKAYRYTEGAGKVCFMASAPTKSLPEGARRGEIFAMLTHRPANKSRGVFSIISGYTYKSGSEVQASIGAQRFVLFTEGDTAWARDEAADKAILQAIRAGSSMTITGTSARGTKTTDTYSLAGSGAALEAINKACP